MKETKYAGTQTEKNLMAAFAGESEARNKYTYFASMVTLLINSMILVYWKTNYTFFTVPVC